MALLDALRARRRIAPHVRRTPLVDSAWLSDIAGVRVGLKLESLQISNSFKSRGAFNAVLARMERGHDAAAQLVTASAGNHGRALAGAAAAFGLPLSVFTPLNAPASKLDMIRRLGATLHAEARDYDEAERMAKAYAASTGAVFISPYSDEDIVAGAATIALELFEDAPDLETIVVPIGGGGLISGVAEASKSINPACRVIGVEAAASCAFQTSLRAGHLVEIVPGPTLADGLAGNPDPDTITFGMIQRFVDDIATVTEDDITQAIVGLVESEHLIVEGAGAVGVAALLTGRALSRSGRMAVVLSGSNIDGVRLARLLAGRSEGKGSEAG
ncbi:MAG TPA: threonine/serine dehydratase [Vicinamibacterales bacterium]|jgi:threonine dehydratase|nr:threonine/serine dehydratase [Vicinamibacterales bacterium]